MQTATSKHSQEHLVIELCVHANEMKVFTVKIQLNINGYE